MMKKYVLCLFLFGAFLASFSMLGCSDVQNEYYEVHVIVVDDQPFYYIDPSDGKDTLGANVMSDGETLFVYLYQPETGIEFSYDQYFATIQSQWVEKDVRNDKLYILATTEIDNQITQFLIDKDNWESTQS